MEMLVKVKVNYEHYDSNEFKETIVTVLKDALEKTFGEYILPFHCEVEEYQEGKEEHSWNGLLATLKSVEVKNVDLEKMIIDLLQNSDYASPNLKIGRGVEGGGQFIVSIQSVRGGLSEGRTSIAPTIAQGLIELQQYFSDRKRTIASKDKEKVLNAIKKEILKMLTPPWSAGNIVNAGNTINIDIVAKRIMDLL